MERKQEIEEINNVIRRKLFTPIVYIQEQKPGGWEVERPVFTSEIAEAIYDAGYSKHKIKVLESRIKALEADADDFKSLYEKYKDRYDRLVGVTNAVEVNCDYSPVSVDKEIIGGLGICGLGQLLSNHEKK